MTTEKKNIDHLHRIIGGLHAKQEDEKEDVVIDEPALELDAARDQVVARILDKQRGHEPRDDGITDLHDERALHLAGRHDGGATHHHA